MSTARKALIRWERLFQIILTVSDVLRQFTGDPGLPPPDKIIRRCWNTDPYSMGSGSYPSVTTTDEDVDHLSRPLPSEADPRLLFAGEATHQHFWGQVRTEGQEV